jgi:uncharacterized membrane protein
MATTFLRRVDTVSLAKVMGLTYAGIGLFIGVICAILSLFGAGLASMAADSNEPWLAVVFGVGAVIFLPLLNGLIGFLGGLIAGLFLNLGLRWAGGLQLELG